MKNYVTDFDLTAAFKALDEIDYDKPEGGLTANRNILNESITDRKGRQTTQSRTLNVERLVEDYYDLEDNQDLNQAAEDRDGDIAQAKLARIEKIVDLDAKTADDLLPSYVGKVIIQCPQCMNLFYKNEEDLVRDEEDPTTCNVNEPCQHCGNISGYTVIGKVDKLDANDQAELGGAAPADDLDLNLDAEATQEEAPAEEAPAENTEAPAEGGEDDLDLDLDLNLEEPAQESLNRSKAAKSDFASENTSKLTTLNEEVDPDLDKKLAAHDSYINYLRSEIESLENAIKNEKNDEIKTAKEAHLAELQQALDEALPEAVKNAPVAEETPVAETEVEAEAETEVTPEADGTDKVGIEDLPTEEVQESLTEDKRDDDDFYGKDVDDAVIQLKKKGHAEFWCRQGKGKAEEVKKIVKDKYNLDVEYTIDDDYCEAKVVKAKEESLNKSEAQKDAEEKSDLATDITSEHKSLQEGSAAQMLAAFEASLDEDGPVEESVNKAEIDANTVPENASANKSINEGDAKACEGEACQECEGAACEAKPEDDLDEAVAITIGVEEVEDTVTPTPDTMIIAEPETDTAAIYTPDSTEPTISIGAQPIEVEENPFGQEFDAEYDDEPEVDPFDQDFDEYEEESEDDDDNDNEDDNGDDDDKPESDETEDTEADDEDTDDEEDEDDDKKDESLKESLQEGIWDKVKAAGKAVASAAKNVMVGKGNILDTYINSVVKDNAPGYSVATTINGKVDYKQANTYAEAEKIATNSSNLAGATQSIILFNDNDKTRINAFKDGKQHPVGKDLMAKAAKHAQASVNLNGAGGVDVNNLGDEPAANANANANNGANAANGGSTPVQGTVVNNQAQGQAQGTATDNVIDAEWSDVPQDVKQKFDTWVSASKQLGMNQQSIETVKQHLLSYYGQNKQLGAPTQESLQEDLSDAFEDALTGLDEINKESEKIMADAAAGNAEADVNPDVAEDETNEGLLSGDINVNLDASGQNNAVGLGASQPVAGTNVNSEAKPVEEGILSAAGDVVNGVVDGVKDLLADNADDAKDATGFETIDDKYQSTGFGDETPNTEADADENTEADEIEVAENLQEDVSDAEYDQMLKSDVFQDFSEEINPDELEDIDEESVNECTTNYLKEVYSNVDKFELTQGDVKNGVLVLEGVIKFHSGAERTTTFGYNLNSGLNLKGVNEDLAKGGEFVMSCTLENKKLIAESLSYKYEVNGQLIEGLIRR